MTGRGILLGGISKGRYLSACLHLQLAIIPDWINQGPRCTGHRGDRGPAESSRRVSSRRVLWLGTMEPRKVTPRRRRRVRLYPGCMHLESALGLLPPRPCHFAPRAATHLAVRCLGPTQTGGTALGTWRCRSVYQTRRHMQALARALLSAGVRSNAPYQAALGLCLPLPHPPLLRHLTTRGVATMPPSNPDTASETTEVGAERRHCTMRPSGGRGCREGATAPTQRNPDCRGRPPPRSQAQGPCGLQWQWHRHLLRDAPLRRVL